MTMVAPHRNYELKERNFLILFSFVFLNILKIVERKIVFFI